MSLQLRYSELQTNSESPIELDLARDYDSERIQALNKNLEVYKALLDANPTNSAAYNNIGIIYSELGDTDKALEAFNTAIENDANNADAFNNMGVILHESGRLEDAERAFRKALELDPGNSITLDNLRRVKEDQLQQRLFDAGLITEIRKPITDFTPYQNRTLIKVKGKPLSEIIIEERR